MKDRLTRGESQLGRAQHVWAQVGMLCTQPINNNDDDDDDDDDDLSQRTQPLLHIVYYMHLMHFKIKRISQNFSSVSVSQCPEMLCCTDCKIVFAACLHLLITNKMFNDVRSVCVTTSE
jgi:hypothetical protein